MTNGHNRHDCFDCNCSPSLHVHAVSNNDCEMTESVLGYEMYPLGEAKADRTRSSAIAEGLRNALVSTNLATTKHPILK